MQKLRQAAQILDTLPGCRIRPPTVILTGKQSYGKSSLLEGLIGTEFNYISTNVATLVPLHFSCRRNPAVKEAKWKMTYQGRVLTDLSQIRKFLGQVNAELFDASQVGTEEIQLELTSAEVHDLDFLDLPGSPRSNSNSPEIPECSPLNPKRILD